MRSLQANRRAAGMAPRLVPRVRDVSGWQGFLGASAGAEDDGPLAEGDLVRVLTMGGASGRVTAPPGRRGGKLAVKVGSLVVGDLRYEDVVRARAGDRVRAGEGAAPPAPSSRRRRRAGMARQGPKEMEPGSGSPGSASAEPARVQFNSNTCDLRGLRVEAALAKMEEALADAPDDACLFVVHGIGSGRLRKEVRAALAHAGVARYEDEPSSAGGCTVVFT